MIDGDILFSEELLGLVHEHDLSLGLEMIGDQFDRLLSRLGILLSNLINYTFKN